MVCNIPISSMHNFFTQMAKYLLLSYRKHLKFLKENSISSQINLYRMGEVVQNFHSYFQNHLNAKVVKFLHFLPNTNWSHSKSNKVCSFHYSLFCKKKEEPDDKQKIWALKLRNLWLLFKMSKIHLLKCVNENIW